MTPRLLAVLGAALALAAPALAGDIYAKKHSVDSRIANLHDRLATQRQREDALKSQIASVTTQIRTLEGRVGDVSLQLQSLEQDLALHEVRLHKIEALYALETARLNSLRAQYKASVERLDQRLVDIYESNRPDTLAVVLSSASIQDVLDEMDYLREIGRQDKRVAIEVGKAKAEVTVARARTAKTKAGVQSETQVIAVRTEQTRSVRNRLVSNQQQLSAERQHQKQSLQTLTSAEQAEASEIDALQAVSADLGARIRAAQAGQSVSSGAAPPPSSGALAWPVSGPVTSPFGWRWGRMHQGIDIGAASGTPIHAAASGTIIYAGWEDGYGNLVVIDHGSSLATAYGHQSAIAVSNGQQVAQGQVIGYVGCTGHCTGPHLHFEVRVNGNPVDPLGYL